MSAKKKPSKRAAENSERNHRPGRVGRPEVRGEVIRLDPMERESAVCNLFAEGLKIPQIQERMLGVYREAGRLRREQVYRIVRAAAKKNRLKYVPDADSVIGQKILDHYSGLRRAHVVRTSVSTDVARETADLLLRLVRHCHLADEKRNEVHIGFAAGLSMREVAQAFARLLTYPAHQLPANIVFHALVAGHDPKDPTTDPNAFFTFFLTPPPADVTPSFMGFHAPAMVQSPSLPKLRSTPELREAYDAAKKLDIIVTSGSDWDDPHSALRFCMERSEASMEKLRALKVVGDMLWRPLGMEGPILQQTDIRALTVMELTDLPGFIREGKHVLLMLGPCGKCGRPKGALLHAILSQKDPLASHLVADSRTALELMRFVGAA